MTTGLDYAMLQRELHTLAVWWAGQCGPAPRPGTMQQLLVDAAGERLPAVTAAQRKRLGHALEKLLVGRVTALLGEHYQEIAALLAGEVPLVIATYPRVSTELIMPLKHLGITGGRLRYPQGVSTSLIPGKIITTYHFEKTEETIYDGAATGS